MSQDGKADALLDPAAQLSAEAEMRPRVFRAADLRVDDHSIHYREQAVRISECSDVKLSMRVPYRVCRDRSIRVQAMRSALCIYTFEIRSGTGPGSPRSLCIELVVWPYVEGFNSHNDIDYVAAFISAHATPVICLRKVNRIREGKVVEIGPYSLSTLGVTFKKGGVFATSLTALPYKMVETRAGYERLCVRTRFLSISPWLSHYEENALVFKSVIGLMKGTS